jgi:formate dehydrogenase gamma subunit
MTVSPRSPRFLTRSFLIPAALLLASPLAAQTASCLDCHDDPDLSLERAGQLVSLTVSAGEFAGTPHEGFDCADCHGWLDENDLPHADPIPLAVAGCLDCHDDLAASHAFHPSLAALDAETVGLPGNNCSDCHGRHTILAGGEADHPFSASRQTRSCGACHEQESISFLHSAHARATEEGVASSPGCLDCHLSEQMVASNGFAEVPRKERLANLCVSCHMENPEVSGLTLYGTPFITSFAASVHGKALYAGNPDAPTCTDCHGSHNASPATDANSNVSRGHVVASCAQCHPEAVEDYLHSAHATALTRRNRLAPVCTDCHGEHNILANTDPGSPVAPANLAEQVCGDCHGSYTLTERFGLNVETVRTFEDSFHGLAARGGAVEVVNCASCHGYHDVRSENDPESLVHPDNLAKTCGNCHEGANERFAKGKVHVSIDRSSQEPVLYWIATIYIWGIFLIVGGMVIHNGLDFFHKVRMKATSHWFHYEHHASEDAPHRLYLRMTLNERLQHGILALSFIILVVTGFMLRYPEAWWVVGLRNLSSHAFEWRGLIHRIAGVVMLLAGVWHVAYLALTRRGRELLRDLLPCWKDLADMKGIFRYNLGLDKERPKFARFSYIEKTEYWALIWGSILMTVTGFLLWYENTTIGLFTKLGFDISRTIHFYEAILATLAIIVWHFYFVIFNPDVYPMNLSWLTGKMSEEEMETEHPLELERLKRLEAGQAHTQDGPETGPERGQGDTG